MGHSLSCGCGDRRLLWPHPLSYSLSVPAKDPTLCGLLEKKVREKVWEGGRRARGSVTCAPVSRSVLAWCSLAGIHEGDAGEWGRMMLAGTFLLILYIPPVLSNKPLSRDPVEPWGSTPYSLQRDCTVVRTQRPSLRCYAHRHLCIKGLESDHRKYPRA